jgi:hypothetical protein
MRTCLLTFAASLALAADPVALWPSAAVPPQLHGKEAFAIAADGATVRVAFADRDKQDDYTHLDLGIIDAPAWRDGGSLEVDLELDRPVLRLTASLAEPSAFWPTRTMLEGEMRLDAGRQTVRFWLDRQPMRSPGARPDHLYLMLHDLGGETRGEAQLRLHSIRLLPGTGDWRAEKRTAYARQYRHPAFPRDESVYRERLERAGPWAVAASAPGLQRATATAWRRHDAGERSWDAAFLADTAFAAPGFDDTAWKTTDVPEPLSDDQPGGHRLYRAIIDLPEGPRGRTWLRLDDVCDWAEVWLNGVPVGTQTSVNKRLDWVVPDGSRFPFMAGKSAKQAMTWRHFDRCGIPWPFDSSAIPDDAPRLALPLGWGRIDWSLAFDVSDVARPGRNVLAVRLYGNPMRGWWIYRHREDRAARNIHGILGEVLLAWGRPGGLAEVRRDPPHAVGSDGTALHRFTATLQDGVPAGVRLRVAVDGTQAEVSAGQAAELRLPAGFSRRTARISLIGSDSREIDARELSFHTAVVSWDASGLRVNGDRFVVHGSNASMGVEWQNDRRTTTAEYLRHLDLLRDLGFNSIRVEGAAPWHLRLAFDRGMMTLPVEPAASTDYGIQALGRFDDPDLQLATDRHRLLAIQLGEEPNILAWNIGNEIHHTPGYDDRQQLERYLDAAREAVQGSDPYRRPTLFANLDSWRQDWFFLGTQDIVGWNMYDSLDGFRACLDEIGKAANGRSLLFTEIGLYAGEKDRKGREDAFEADFAERWRIATTDPRSAGAFNFPHHGELDDQRGRDFLRRLVLPVSLVRDADGGLALRSGEASPMRRVEVAGRAVAGLEPGMSLALPALPPGTAVPVAYETHRGLVHRYVLTAP